MTGIPNIAHGDRGFYLKELRKREKWQKRQNFNEWRK